MLQIYRVENMDIVELEKRYYGELYGGDSYLIHYTYAISGREEHIIYYWLVSAIHSYSLIFN